MMSAGIVTPAGTHYIVVNSSCQYSIWAAPKPLPSGWSVVDEADSHAEALTKVTAIWGPDGPRRSGGHRMTDVASADRAAA